MTKRLMITPGRLHSSTSRRPPSRRRQSSPGESEHFQKWRAQSTAPLFRRPQRALPARGVSQMPRLLLSLLPPSSRKRMTSLKPPMKRRTRMSMILRPPENTRLPRNATRQLRLPTSSMTRQQITKLRPATSSSHSRPSTAHALQAKTTSGEVDRS